MTSQMNVNAKIRLVRCPRCQLLLPEQPDIPIYKCGGCGTVLKAKPRKTDTKGTGLHCDATDEKGKREAADNPEKNEVSHLTQNATISSKGESLDGASTSRSFENTNAKQPGDENFSNELPISPSHSCHGNQDLSPEHKEQVGQDENQCLSDEDSEERKSECGDCYSECHNSRSLSDDLPSSMELTCHEMEDSSPELQAHIALDEDNYVTQHCTRMDKIEYRNCKREHKDINFLNNVSSMIEDEHENSYSSPKCGAHGQGDEGIRLIRQDSTTNECKFPENISFCREISSSTKIAPREQEMPLAVAEAQTETDEELKGHIFESLKAEDTLDTKKIEAVEIPLEESSLLDNALSTDNQHLKLREQKFTTQGFSRASSVDSLDNLAVAKSSFELGVRQTDLPKFPTRCYYGYDGSVSSYDGTEDQIPSRFSKPPKRKLKHSNGLHIEDESRVKDFLSSKVEMHREGILGSGVDDLLVTESESEVQHQEKRSLIFQEKNHHASEYRKRDQDHLPGPRSCSHSSGSRMRADKEEHGSRIPFVPRYSQAGQRNESPSSYLDNAFRHYSGFCSPDTPLYPEPDKMELLRTVYELKDELRRTQISRSKFPTRFIGDEQQSPLFYDHLVPPEEIYADLRYSIYPGRSRLKGLPQLHKVSRTGFSGEAADRLQVDCSCFRCCPQDWRFSEQLPSHKMCCNKIHHVVHNGHNIYKGSCSTSSSPQHYMSSVFLRGCETKSDNQRHRDNEMRRLHVREKCHLTKRHLRPVAGGVPILACYHCSELLLLPVDFILFGRRCHKVRCNSCGKIMKFSLQRGIHLVPEIPDTVAPPPSMIDGCSDSFDQRDWASASYSNKCPNAEPLSYSDDYGLSIDRSYSTEGDPSREPLRGTDQNRNISTGSSYGHLDDQKMKSVPCKSEIVHERSAETTGSAGPSSKVSKWRKASSEIKELPPSSGSPLHRLMGYSSPSQVIKP